MISVSTEQQAGHTNLLIEDWVEDLRSSRRLEEQAWQNACSGSDRKHALMLDLIGRVPMKK